MFVLTPAPRMVRMRSSRSCTVTAPAARSPKRRVDPHAAGRLDARDGRPLSPHRLEVRGRRGWRLDKPDRSSPIDSLIALAMALDHAEHQPERVQLVGWL